MRRLNRLFLFPTVAVSALLAQRSALAAEPHSWCVTGAPMVQGGSTDATTNAVISNVCGNAAFSSCCASTGGRWGLSCVQVGAAFAKQNNLSGGDFCGRYQWAQGPLPNTQQFYPRDFNMFATSGGIATLRDSDGPIAASGQVSVSSFHLNIKGREPVALAGAGNVFLSNGTVNGSVLFGGNYSDPGVTFFGATRPTARSNPFPIPFSTVSANLIAMSQALQRYDAKAATKANSNVTFAGSDPELNVFSIASTSLTGTTSYTVSVPASSNVIINVSGTNPAIANAGFSVGVNLTKVLWNFPDATSLSVQSVGFPGSILAPRAVGNFQNGSVIGTVVVAAAQPGNVELYTAAYQIPSCTGGLCLDPTWSVSGDTPIDDNGNAALVKDEAGFLEIAGGSYVGEGVARTGPKHRVWYSFQPAKTNPKGKPLAIFFNGGPGAATSCFLFAFNTGPRTLDPQLTGTSSRVVTSALANDWSQLANLLYVDAPATGFSYPVANDDGSKPDIGIDMDREAGIVTRVLLRFLKRHPTLLKNRVVIVGESYGGIRATLMLQEIYNYASLTNTGSAYQDTQLSNELQAYFSPVFGTTTPSAVQLATKFGHQVLIQPVVVGDVQMERPTRGSGDAFNFANCINPTCMNTSPTLPTSCDPYNCDKPANWSDALEARAGSNLTDITTLQIALGVDPRTIEWMKASSRVKAYGRNDGAIISPLNLATVFGTLNAEDNYLLSLNDAVNDGFAGASDWFSLGQGLIQGRAYVNNLHNNVTTLITDTKFDTVVYTPDIPYALEVVRGREPSFASLVSGLGYSSTVATGLPRPGLMQVNYFPATDFRTALMPHSYASGHTVPMRAPKELLADVTQWYQSSPH